ncbi:hypothetical protein AVEN_269117-1 [Araneus ventricosus]|uniref:Uncharacterized protein n=1 Tax=Araneus ventricosus TaxID=182803 RepID=A0A4Y2VQR9_ARAVE|nr:hypothetical protein AVEN_269117-1 [Araneus ventricosus]
MSKQSHSCCHHPLSWSRRVSSELWPQKVQGPPPRDPFYVPAGGAVHSLISSAPESPGRRMASLGKARKCIAHHPAVDHFHQTVLAVVRHIAGRYNRYPYDF